ncbi:hypothetical protein [Kitasatospora sp. NPDC002040]|uniref:hypothetical protein n=1 Tax=Kitasatospora sp. NPDC002040 TaxID=3154661 RepID=UPI0033220402
MEIFNGFAKTYLNSEMAFGYLPRVRSTIASSAPEWGESIRREFAQVISERPLSVAQYCDMTWVEFESDDALYEYLGKVFEYLFVGGDQVPLPPDE